MFKNSHFDFIGKRKIFFSISCTLIALIALISVVFGVEMDIQFKGGTIITYSYDGTIIDKEVKDIAEKAIGTSVSVKLKAGINGKDSFDISLTELRGLEAEKLTALTDALESKYAGQISLLSNASVNPSIGKEFFLKSLVAVGFAALILIAYIGLRFKKISGWSAGVMAVAALFHDVIIVFGTFVIFRMPLDYNFIAVILTILGYSINDTIIIYDRIRENKRLYGKNLSTEQLVNNSINETLARTINTTTSTLIAMIVISVVALLSGVNSILSFSFPMIIGMLSGTYSTVFIAGPLWVQWQNHKAKKLAKK